MLRDLEVCLARCQMFPEVCVAGSAWAGRFSFGLGLRKQSGEALFQEELTGALVGAGYLVQNAYDGEAGFASLKKLRTW